MSWYSAPMWSSSLNAGTLSITGGHTVCAPAGTQSQAELSTNVAPARIASCCSTLTSLRYVSSRLVKHAVMSDPSRQLLHGRARGVWPMTIVFAAARLNAARLDAISARDRNVRHDEVLAQQEHVGVKRADPLEHLGLVSAARRRGYRPVLRAGPATSVRREDVNAPRRRVERAPDGVAEHLRVRISVQHCHVCGGRIPDDAFARRYAGRSRMHGGGKAIERCGESGRRDGGSCRSPRPARISRCQERSVLAYAVSSAGVPSAPARNNDRLAGCETVAALTGMAVERSGSIADSEPHEDGREDECTHGRRNEIPAAPQRACPAPGRVGRERRFACPAARPGSS